MTISGYGEIATLIIVVFVIGMIFFCIKRLLK